MTWIKLLDDFPEHPKTLEAGEDAAWLFVCGLAYCSRNLTDGVIANAIIPRLSGQRQPLKLADRLVAAGLWSKTETGFEIVNYLKHQTSAERVKANRRAAADRKARERESRASHGECHAVTNDEPSRDMPPPAHTRSRAGAPARSGSGVVAVLSTTDDDGERQGGVSELLDAVVRILKRAPRFTFDPGYVAVENTIAAFRHLDPKQAAHIAASNGMDPSYRTTDGARALRYAFLELDKAGAGKRPPDARRERPDYDKAAGLT